jgi:DNA-binding transcriptional regulator YiaG
MPNINKVLREEITRLSRREMRATSARLKKGVQRAHSACAELKARIRMLEARIVELARRTAAAPAEAVGAEAGAAGVKIRPTGAMIRKLRARLGLPQTRLAKLLGVSAQSVTHWESNAGKLKMRERTRQSLLKIRSLGKRAVRRMVAEQK